MDEQIKILCVDDERNVLRALERLFLDEDYEIITALSGQEGLELMGSVGPVQIVISDYRMPGMNGVDFLREVCRCWPETVRIVLSGYADTTAVVTAINEGEIYKFIPKPWNDDELKVTLGNALERYFLHQHNCQLMERLAESNEELQAMNENLQKLIAEGTNELMSCDYRLARSRFILDSLPVAVMGVDSEGVIASCNRAGGRILGLDEEEIIGMRQQDILTPGMNGFVENIRHREAVSGVIPINGVGFRAKGDIVECQGREMIVMVFDSEV
ncbi:MAG TPA: response regulator [Geobacteraceae bacterium]|nr:response regulator [Geobacteraceae bacterium]